MRIALLASTALVLSTFAVATPVAAQSGTTASTMVSTCSTVKPADTTQHVYTSEPSNIVAGAPVVTVTRTTISSTPGSTVPVLTGASYVAGTEHRNGGSPNIHGTFVSTATYAGPSLTQRVVTVSDTTYTFGCRVGKRNVKNNNTEYPTSIQRAYAGEITERTNVSDINETVTGDPVVERFFSEMVICNSPGSKGGQWRAQNGYGGGMCNTASYLALPGRDPSSNSIPNFAPLNHQPDTAANNAPFDNLDMSPIIDPEPEVTEISEPTAEL